MKKIILITICLIFVFSGTVIAAEFLVKAIDAVHADSVKDKRGCYKRGDVVVVMPDGHVWGKAEGLPKFVIVRVPGLAVDAARKYLESEMDAASENIITRRKFKLLLDNVPISIKNQLKSTGEVTVSWTTAKQYIKNKITGVTE